MEQVSQTLLLRYDNDARPLRVTHQPFLLFKFVFVLQHMKHLNVSIIITLTSI